MDLDGLERLREEGVCLGGVRGEVFENFFRALEWLRQGFATLFLLLKWPGGSLDL